ncbi:MAG: hypothetical protein HUU38_20025 [Anaerolineales bacterium]|nr:hypothetical protein [Anaerolineales bacterium]
MQFSFATTGEYHPSGLGAWAVALTPTGELSATWKRAGHTTLFGPFSLTREENARVWGLIEEMKRSALSSSVRPGIPDEILYTLTLPHEPPLRIELWKGDGQKTPTVQAVTAIIELLIEKYTEQKAYL